MTELHTLVDIAASLSITAKTEDAIVLAARKRDEAMHALDVAQSNLDRMRQILALFPTPMSGNECFFCHIQGKKGVK